MQNKIVLFLSIFFLFNTAAFAEMLLFVDSNCEHCEKLEFQMQQQSLFSENEISKYEISSEENLRLYFETSKEVGYTNGGVPLLVDQDKYIEGTDAILQYLGGQSASEIPSNNTLGLDDSAELNAMIATMIENEDQQDSSNVIPGATVAEFDLLTLALGALFLIALMGFLYYLSKRKSRR